jgi:ubiquinone/menaquinone biosynthesis C-methylase UbiE
MLSVLRFLYPALSLLIIGNAVAQTPHTNQHSFSGAENWAKIFDDPDRDRWQKPHEVIMALKLTPDAKIADIGAGTGYFAARLAHMTPGGRVYAVDLEPDMVKHLGERAKREGLNNLQPVQAKPDSAALSEKSGSHSAR